MRGDGKPKLNGCIRCSCESKLSDLLYDSSLLKEVDKNPENLLEIVLGFFLKHVNGIFEKYIFRGDIENSSMPQLQRP